MCKLLSLQISAFLQFLHSTIPFRRNKISFLCYYFLEEHHSFILLFLSEGTTFSSIFCSFSKEKCLLFISERTTFLPFCCSFLKEHHFFIFSVPFQRNNIFTLCCSFMKEQQFFIFLFLYEGTTFFPFAIPFLRKNTFAFCCSFPKEQHFHLFSIPF